MPDNFCAVEHEGVRRTRIGDERSWSHASYPAFKVTGDGASFQNAPKGQRKCTSFFLILLGTGVLKEYDWGGLVSR